MQIPTYWIGTLLSSPGSDVSITLEGDGSIFSAHILLTNGQQLRITRVTNFIENHTDLLSAVFRLEDEDLIIFNIDGYKKYSKRQSPSK